MRRPFLLTILTFFIYAHAGFAQPAGDQALINKADSILSLLTLEEKVALCHGNSLFTIPGVPRLGIPEVWMSDGPHGIRPEINLTDWSYAGWTTDSATAFPSLTCLAATFNPEIAYRYGKALGEEARARGKDVLLGPGINIYRTPLNGRNFEYMGEDPALASSMVVPYIQGVQSNGVAACVKHYALNNQETGRHHINVEVSDRALYERYLPAFKAAVHEGQAWAIMGAYNKYQGQHCSHNQKLLNDILKRDWGFDGVVISDWGGTHDTWEAALNGLDIEMGSNVDFDNNYLANPFKDLLLQGKIDEAVLDDKARRIILLMLRTVLDENRPPGTINTPEHSKVAYETAIEGMVLMKNADQFFPLDTLNVLNILVVGENAQRTMTDGGGSSELKARYEISPLKGIHDRFPYANITFTKGYSSGKENRQNLVEEALTAAAKADLVMFVGGLNKERKQDSEEEDRQSYSLPYQQDELIQQLSAVNDEIAVILISGNAVSMPWISEVKAVWQIWYGGSEAGHALADLIGGIANPSGKLPFTFPMRLADNAAHRHGKRGYPGKKGTVIYKEGIFGGYGWHENQRIAPLFAFGHGLSYTTFVLSDLQIDQSLYRGQDTLELTFRLTNTGARDGAEVVQLYIGKDDAEVERPLKELKGFDKVFLPTGATGEGMIQVPVKALSYYDEKAASWQLERGIYTLHIGTASNRIWKTYRIKVQ